MAARVEQGFLVLADLSGFTEFLSTTELEHGPQITAALLETVMARLAPPFEVQEVEGDAVFAVGPDAAIVRPVTVLDVLESTFVAFKRQQRDMQIGTTCPCNACRAIPMLSLKLVAHHGSYLRQSVGGRGQLAGPEVILAHRLLKNHVEGPRAYVLLSEAAAKRTEVDAAAAGLAPHVERYDHLGEVRCFVGDLEPAWRRALEASVVRVGPEERLGQFEVRLPVPPHVAWDWMLSPDKRRIWQTDVTEVREESAGRPGVGTLSHCHHGDGSVVADVILDWRPFEYYTRECRVGDIRVRETVELVPEAGGCLMTSLWGSIPGAPESHEPAKAFFGIVASIAPIEFARLEALLRAESAKEP